MACLDLSVFPTVSNMQHPVLALDNVRVRHVWNVRNMFGPRLFDTCTLSGYTCSRILAAWSNVCLHTRVMAPSAAEAHARIPQLSSRPRRPCTKRPSQYTSSSMLKCNGFVVAQQTNTLPKQRRQKKLLSLKGGTVYIERLRGTCGYML